MAPPPERPSNDMGRLNAPLRKPCGDAANFLRRSVDEGWLCFRIIDGGGFLGRQSLLARYFLHFRQIGIRIAAKAGTQSACLAPLIETVAKLLPLASIGTAQIGATGWRLAGRDGRDQARLTAQHDGGRGGLAAGGPSLVVALRAEFVFQIVVGARQVRNTVAVKQPRTVAARDLAEALDRTAQVTGTVAMAHHGAHHSIEPALHHGRVLAVMVVQDMGGFVHPRIGALNVRPQHRGLRQAVLDQTLQARERRRGPPFSAARSTLAATFSSRPFSLRPAASKGAWPSSVMALRTAAQ